MENSGTHLPLVMPAGSSSGWAVVGCKSRGLASAPVAVSEAEESPKAGSKVKQTYLQEYTPRNPKHEMKSLELSQSPAASLQAADEEKPKRRQLVKPQRKILKVCWKRVALWDLQTFCNCRTVIFYCS